MKQMPQYEHLEVVGALQIRAMEWRDDGHTLLIHFYGDIPPMILPKRISSGTPGLNRFMVADEYGYYRFIDEKEFQVSYRKIW